jgi:hypothetical protein
MQKQVKIFIIYSEKNINEKRKLFDHLSGLRNSVKIFDNENISPDASWEEVESENIMNSNLILLLLSSDFSNSNKIWDGNLNTAKQLHYNKKAKVVRILLKPCHIVDDFICSLDCLPTNGKFIHSAGNNSEILYKDTVKEIAKIINNLNSLNNTYKAPNIQQQVRKTKNNNFIVFAKNEIQKNINKVYKSTNGKLLVLVLMFFIVAFVYNTIIKINDQNKKIIAIGKDNESYNLEDDRFKNAISTINQYNDSIDNEVELVKKETLINRKKKFAQDINAKMGVFKKKYPESYNMHFDLGKILYEIDKDLAIKEFNTTINLYETESIYFGNSNSYYCCLCSTIKDVSIKKYKTIYNEKCSKKKKHCNN